MENEERLRTIKLMRKLGNQETPVATKTQRTQASVNKAMSLDGSTNAPAKNYSKDALKWLRNQFAGAPLGEEVTAGLETMTGKKKKRPEDEEVEE